jgi:hypothetical protein
MPFIENLSNGLQAKKIGKPIENIGKPILFLEKSIVFCGVLT